MTNESLVLYFKSAYLTSELLLKVLLTSHSKVYEIIYISYTRIIRGALSLNYLNMKLLIQFLPERSRGTEGSKYVLF